MKGGRAMKTWTVISISLDNEETAWDVLKAKDPLKASETIFKKRGFQAVAVIPGKHPTQLLLSPGGHP